MLRTLQRRVKTWKALYGKASEVMFELRHEPGVMGNSQPKDICQVRCFNAELVNHAQNTLPSENILETVQIIFGALADRLRLKILYALSHDQELCVCAK